MSNPTIKTPTAAAIETATKNAEKLEDYIFKPSEGVPEIWFAIKPGGKAWYLVDTRSGECNCPYHAQEGICKHSVRVAEELRIREMEQAYEDHRDMLASRD